MCGGQLKSHGDLPDFDLRFYCPLLTLPAAHACNACLHLEGLHVNATLHRPTHSQPGMSMWCGASCDLSHAQPAKHDGSTAGTIAVAVAGGCSGNIAVAHFSGGAVAQCPSGKLQYNH